jgi:hypothetical protein
MWIRVFTRVYAWINCQKTRVLTPKDPGFPPHGRPLSDRP